MNIEMINKVPTYNANIGSEFDDASVILKKKNTDYTEMALKSLTKTF